MPDKDKSFHGSTTHSSSQPAWKWIADLFQSTARPRDERKLGIEVERIGIWPNGDPWLYSEKVAPSGKTRPGAQQLLGELERRHGWPMIKNDEGLPLGFASPFGKISLEPGSQLEISTDPAEDLFTLVEHIQGFETAVAEITAPWDLLWLGIGVNPLHPVSNIDVIPSIRYRIMTDYLGERGGLGTAMMRLSSSVQINLDYSDEKEAIEMLRVAVAAAPLAYALFGNSPFMHGKETGYLSYRNLIWHDTDPDRTGLLPEIFEDGFNFSRYAELAWKKPLMFAQELSGHYVETGGASLEKIAGNALKNVRVDETNQINSIREIFTEARLKPGYIEIRSIDGQTPSQRYAAAAFWMGLLYSPEARKTVMRTLGSLTPEARDQLQSAVAKDGIRAKGPIELSGLSRDLVAAANDCLKARNKGEEAFLEPLEETVEEQLNPADRLLEEWKGRIASNQEAFLRTLVE